jgi:hypothetical protein
MCRPIFPSHPLEYRSSTPVMGKEFFMFKSTFFIFLQIQTILLLRFGLIYCIDYFISLLKNILLVILVYEVVIVHYHLDDPHTTCSKISF